MQKITPFLWFDNNAEEALNFYTSIFKNSEITQVSRYGDVGPGPKGSLLTARFNLEGQEFLALNGGPQYKFTPAVSFLIDCKTQEEIDYYWDKLLEGGQAQQCGWLVDKYGLSWQVVPAILPKYLSDKDAGKASRVMQTMMKMVKLDIQELEDAYKG